MNYDLEEIICIACLHSYTSEAKGELGEWGGRYRPLGSSGKLGEGRFLSFYSFGGTFIGRWRFR